MTSQPPISAQPPVPPHYGPPPYGPPPAKRPVWPWVLLGVFLMPVLAFAACVVVVGAGAATSAGTSASSSTPGARSVQTKTQGTPTVISAGVMANEFEANQIAAERKWGGQYVQFTAVVGNINSSGVSFTNVTSTYSFTQISCRVEDENQLVNLVKGSQATVRGVVSDDQLMGVIGINDCEVVG